jgi:hypothetical protein
MLISLLATVISIFTLNGAAHAHFIVKDNDTGIKASLHISPDHDPIAGKESVISFDFAKTGLQVKDYSYSLIVKSTKDKAVTVPVIIVSNVIMANYTFPTQGFYDVSLITTSNKDGSVSKLRYGQRVSRGVIIESNKGFGLLEISMVAGAMLVAVGAIIVSLISDNKQRGKK